MKQIESEAIPSATATTATGQSSHTIDPMTLSIIPSGLSSRGHTQTNGGYSNVFYRSLVVNMYTSNFHNELKLHLRQGSIELEGREGKFSPKLSSSPPSTSLQILNLKQVGAYHLLNGILKKLVSPLRTPHLIRLTPPPPPPTTTPR